LPFLIPAVVYVQRCDKDPLTGKAAEKSISYKDAEEARNGRRGDFGDVHISIVKARQLALQRGSPRKVEGIGQDRHLSGAHGIHSDAAALPATAPKKGRVGERPAIGL
jgi:hypothetical protein